MSEKKKGQSALEYLVTYGWAILAIVIIAAVLWYFGIFNPSVWAGSSKRAVGFTSFTILDQKLNSTGAAFSFGNIIGQDVRIDGLAISLDTNRNSSNVVPASGTDNSIAAGASKGFSTSFTTSPCATAGATYTDVLFIISYTNTKTGLSGLTDAGKLTGTCS